MIFPNFLVIENFCFRLMGVVGDNTLELFKIVEIQLISIYSKTY